MEFVMPLSRLPGFIEDLTVALQTGLYNARNRGVIVANPDEHFDIQIQLIDDEGDDNGENILYTTVENVDPGSTTTESQVVPTRTETTTQQAATTVSTQAQGAGQTIRTDSSSEESTSGNSGTTTTVDTFVYD